MALLAPSVIAGDYGCLRAGAEAALTAGADWLHVDVMDGHFVPNLTVGPGVVKALRPLATEHDALLDVHLMIEQPNRYVEDFAAAGADVLTVHAETAQHLHRVVQRIRQAGCRPGVALNPSTPLSALDEILPRLDLVLVMSVNPGFSGQDFIPEATGKVRRLHQTIEQAGASARIEVDGGVTPGNAHDLMQAGADVLVAGSAVFGEEEHSVEDNVAALREALTVRA